MDQLEPHEGRPVNSIDAELIASFRETLDEQVRNTLARRIRGKVRDARSDPDHAAKRWPFELHSPERI